MSKPFEVSLDNCHEEPIHIPGSIQPHGFLLVIDPQNLSIRYLSENLAELLETTPDNLLHAPLSEIVNPELIETIKAHQDVLEFYKINPLNVTLNHPSAQLSMSAVLSECEGNVMIELERRAGAAFRHFDPENYLVKHSLHSIVDAEELETVFSASVEEIRSLTNFDRVMLYKFDHEYNGEVVAEAKRDDLNSFLQQHFPESDIPKQARELYLRNPIRLLADVDAGVSPIYPQDEPVDLSTCILRSVSPIHCQYLRNMGVRASMSISIITAGKLWGLVACHHYSAHVVPFETREVAQYMGIMLSYLITLKTQSYDALREAKLLSLSASISERMSEEVFFTNGLRQNADTLMEMMNATGVAWCLEENIECYGNTPSPEQIAAIASWIADNKLGNNYIFQSHQLGIENEAFAHLNDTASGVFLISLSASCDLFLIWFRKEVVQTKNWGGKPEKVIEFLDDGSHRLMPRSSFALWKENVSNKSAPWEKAEISCASKFRNTVINYVLAKSERLQKINDALEDMVRKRTEALESEFISKERAQTELAKALKASEESNRELERFAFVASHDLQEPLRKIQTFGTRIQRSKDVMDEANAYYLGRMMDSADRMQQLIKGVLSFSRIHRRGSEFKSINAADVFQEILDDLEILIADNDATITCSELGRLYGDKRQIQRLFQNLIHNSLKFMTPGLAPNIAITITHKTEQFITVSVTDNGIGFDTAFTDKIFNLFERLHARDSYEGTGLGLAICKKIVERHQGKIWADAEEGKGATFFITLPLAKIEPAAD